LGFILLALSILALYFVAPARADFTAGSKNISNSAADSLFPKIVSLPGTSYVFVVWIEVSGDEDLLYFSRSTDGGASWSTPYQLTPPGQIRSHSGISDNDYIFDFFNLSMAVQDPIIHIVYQWRPNATSPFRIAYARSTDLGATTFNWSFTTLTSVTADSIHPDIAVRGEYVHIAYDSNWPGNECIMYKRIAGSGAGAVDQTRRLTFSTTGAYFPRIAVSAAGDIVSIVYEDDVSGAYNILYKNISSSGAGAYSSHQLTFSASGNDFPDIATSAGTPPEDQYVYIVYESRSWYPTEMMYKRLDNYGQPGFSVSTARLTYSSGQSRFGSVDFDDANNIVNISYTDTWPGNFDVMHKKFANFGGGGFTSQRVSWGTGDSTHPSIAAIDTGACIAWSDDTSGNYEILVKKGS
jgi:hypothetical protein